MCPNYSRNEPTAVGAGQSMGRARAQEVYSRRIGLQKAKYSIQAKVYFRRGGRGLYITAVRLAYQTGRARAIYYILYTAKSPRGQLCASMVNAQSAAAAAHALFCALPAPRTTFRG
eukprot:271959-Prymnesium_polylepis.1